MAELKQRIIASKAEVAEVVSMARSALRGEAHFGPQQLRTLQATLNRMQPLMLRSKQLRREQPELQPDLDAYKAQLADLQIVLEQIRVMLLARRAQMFSDQSQLQAVSQWANALRQTAEI